MQPPLTYQDQIKVNLEKQRELLWSLCCNGHADAALSATREALSSARAIQSLCRNTTGDCGPADHVARLEVTRVERSRPRRKGGRR